MRQGTATCRGVRWAICVTILLFVSGVSAQEAGKKGSSYAPVDIKEDFATTMARMKAAKAEVMKRQMDLLNERYDLSNRPATERDHVPQQTHAGRCAGQTPAGRDVVTARRHEPRRHQRKGCVPQRVSCHSPIPTTLKAAWSFPSSTSTRSRKQEGRDLTRFDLDFDVPDHFLPEFPAPIYLTTRPDLGDVSQGKLVTIENYYELFNGILNPKQLEGLRLLVTPFPQQQFNQTEDRRTERPSRGVVCFECHANGHTNASTHLVGDIRPQEFRHRIDTPTLRGVNVQRLFGSQRALRSVEDFTEFEQRAAYFDGDPVIAAKKGVNPLERGSQVHVMAEFQELLDFPPAPKLTVFGKLDPNKATEAELRGQELFFGKAQCATCHPAPYYTDNLMHNLRAERFYKPQMMNGRMASRRWADQDLPLAWDQGFPAVPSR